jgi:PhnB protein
MAAKAKKKAKSSAKKVAKKIAKKVAKKKPSTKVAKKARPAAKSARAKAKPARAAKATPPAVPTYHTVTPVLTVEGAEDAIAFYKKAFGATERMRMPGPDGKIMHAEIMIGDSVVMVSDVVQNFPATKASLHIYVPDCDALFDQALAAGAETKMPLQDMFWGDRFGTVSDPYGNTWSLATHKEDVSPEEMEKRMAALPPPDSAPVASA